MAAAVRVSAGSNLVHRHRQLPLANHLSLHTSIRSMAGLLARASPSHTTHSDSPSGMWHA